MPQAPRTLGPAGVADHDPGAFQLAWLVDLETGYTLPCQRYGASRFCCCLNAEAERTRWKVATSEGEVEKLLAGAKGETA